MKINIGPYLNWWGPYQIVELLTHLGVSEDTCHRWAENSPEWFTKLCEWIHAKRHRKIRVYLDKWDTWSMDSTLACIILPMLIQLKATKHGSPGDLEEFDQTSNSAQHCFEFYEEGDEIAWKKGADHWDVIMDKMIYSFCEINKDNEPEFWNAEEEYYDKVKALAYYAKVQEGLDLFGKYYTSLWD